jgi:hypothetical protein
MNNKIIYTILGFLIALTILFVVSCDDFLAPTIEIFNEVKTPVVIEQEHSHEQKKEQSQDNSVSSPVRIRTNRH